MVMSIEVLLRVTSIQVMTVLLTKHTNKYIIYRLMHKIAAEATDS